MSSKTNIVSNPQYKIFIDDFRTPEMVFSKEESMGWTICKSSKEAIEFVNKKGYMPYHIAFDHDLGEDKNGTDTTVKFILWLVAAHLDERVKGEIPSYSIHSSNPDGIKNIESKMETWKKVAG